jgi:hypothetical protein
MSPCALSVPQWPHQTAAAHRSTGQRAREKPKEGLAWIGNFTDNHLSTTESTSDSVVTMTP